jgi:hypothetical protein
MTQTMVLDNQNQYGIDAVWKAMKTQTIFFDKLLINRAFVLNNPDLVEIFRDHANNGFDRLMESGAIALLMVERGTDIPSFMEEWEAAKRANMWGLTDDENYVNWLDQFIEGIDNPVSYLTFDYSGASQNYLSLIKNYCETLHHLHKLSDLVLDDKNMLEYLVETKPSENITRSKLYDEFGIPQIEDEREYKLVKNGGTPEYKSKKLIKEIVDINYNFNIPSLNKLNFHYMETYTLGSKEEKLHDIPIIPFGVRCLVDLNKLSFNDIVNIRENCTETRNEYLESYENLQRRYDQKPLEDFGDALSNYLEDICKLFRNHENIGIHKAILRFDNKYFQCGKEIVLIHEYNIDTKQEEPEPLFRLLCNVGTPEEEHRNEEPTLKRLIYSTNDTGLRG